MLLPPLEYLRHILDETDYLMNETQGLSHAQLVKFGKRKLLSSPPILNRLEPPQRGPG